MSDHVYILGSSADLGLLDKSFFENEVTIGINRSYRRSDDLGVPLTHWLGHDRVLAFAEWIRAHRWPKTFKWVRWEYADEEPLANHFKSVERGTTLDSIVFYLCRAATDYKFKPSYPNGSVQLPMLDDFGFSIFTAISLAILLGFRDIRFRGVSLKGGYYGNGMNEDRVCYHGQMVDVFKKIMPGLKELGVKLTNETVGTDFQMENL